MTREYSYWTQKDVRLLRKLMSEGRSVRQIAMHFGCTDDRIRDRIKIDSMTPDARKANAARAKAWREKQKAAGKNPKKPVGNPRRGTVSSIARPSGEVLADAQRRSLAQHRSLAAALMGDPPIGRSALDRRHGAC